MLGGVDGNLILLNGSIFRDDKSINKRTSILFRGLLINKSETSECIEQLRRANIDNINIPDPLNYYYLYAGEIPWDSGFNGDDISSIIVNQYKTASDRDGRKVSSFSRVLDTIVALPTSVYSWGDTTCVANEVGSAYILSKFLVDDLKLRFKPDGMNFYDQNNRQVSCVIKFQESNAFSNHHEFLYISKDVLNQYLKKHNLSLIWIIWGERALTFEDVNEIQKTTESPVWKRFKFVREYSI